MIKKAMILGAGFGKRLSPLTLDCPKPLLKIGNKTLLSNTINFLKNYQIEEIIINTHYLSHKITNYLYKNSFDLNISTIYEKEKILDTGGGILNAINNFDESFLCINPDTIWNINYINELKKMEREFIINKSKCSLLVVNKSKSFDTRLKGDFNLDNGFLNRKKNNNLEYIYTGLQIIHPDIFSDIKTKIFSMNKIWSKLILNNELRAFESNIEFKHISTLDIYNKLNIK